MLNLDEYKNTLPYPSKQDFMTTFYYRAGKVVAKVTGTPTSAQAAAIKIETQGCVTEKVVDEDAFKSARAAYGHVEFDLANKFKADLLRDNGLEDNKFTEHVFNMAYIQGHSNGHHEIESIFGDMAELDAIAREVYGNK